MHSNRSVCNNSPIASTRLTVLSVLSMTFGRPPLIHNELIQVDLPADVELDDLTDEASERLSSHPERALPSSCALFIASM